MTIKINGYGFGCYSYYQIDRNGNMKLTGSSISFEKTLSDYDFFNPFNGSEPFVNNPANGQFMVFNTTTLQGFLR